MSFVKEVALGCLVVIAAIGCTTTSSSIKETSRPATADSIRELLDALHLDDIVNEFLDFERVALDAKLHSIQANRHFTPAQEQIVDEFFAKVLSVVDEEMSVDRVRQVLTVTIQQSFPQQDIDTVTAFYRSRAGRAVVAKYPYELRAYVQQRQALKIIGTVVVVPELQDSSPREVGILFKPWENREFSEFFGSDVRQDLLARWPAASKTYDAETERIEEEVQTRLRLLETEFKAKFKVAETQ